MLASVIEMLNDSTKQNTGSMSLLMYSVMLINQFQSQSVTFYKNINLEPLQNNNFWTLLHAESNATAISRLLSPFIYIYISVNDYAWMCISMLPNKQYIAFYLIHHRSPYQNT